ncbi:hypothetical protein BU17DRAFT_39519 [Hysterangium stoloniferum]|nr:hypothetical protein BU17DRAFT_39519 [Hysterangium stoloniferum]
MPPYRSAAFDRLRKPYERPTAPATRGSRGDGMWVHDRAPTIPTPSHPAATTRLVVSSLHWEVTEQDLISIFGTIGKLASKPVIRFDRSGRSTGVADVEFSNPAEATRARNQLDGKIAKTQAMSIAYAPPRLPPSVKAAARSGDPDSLLNRIAKPPLLARISTEDNTPKGPAADSRIGPIRTRATRGARGGGGPRAPRERGPKKDKTAIELDKELEAFMGTPANGKENGDVEME